MPTYDERECHKIAAKMIGDGDSGLLNHRLYNRLSDIAEYCEKVGGELKSRQVIAMIVYDWIFKESNGEKVYGD